MSTTDCLICHKWPTVASAIPGRKFPPSPAVTEMVMRAFTVDGTEPSVIDDGRVRYCGSCIRQGLLYRTVFSVVFDDGRPIPVVTSTPLDGTRKPWS